MNSLGLCPLMRKQRQRSCFGIAIDASAVASDQDHPLSIAPFAVLAPVQDYGVVELVDFKAGLKRQECYALPARCKACIVVNYLLMLGCTGANQIIL